jgi:hypothetical protein
MASIPAGTELARPFMPPRAPAMQRWAFESRMSWILRACSGTSRNVGKMRLRIGENAGRHGPASIDAIDQRP